MNRAIIAALLLAIYASMPVPGPFAATAATPLQQALELYRSGTPERAAPQLKAALARHPDDPDAWQAHLALARIYQKQGRPADMLAQLGAIPAERRNTESRFLEGLGLLATGRTSQGIALLRGLPEADLNGNQQQQRLDALVQGSLKLQRHVEALFFLQQQLLHGNDAATTAALLQQAHQLLKEECSDEQLTEAAFLFQGTALGQDAMLQQARRHKEAGRTEQATMLLNAVLNSSTPFPFRDDAQLLLRQLSRDEQSVALGVLLPLSGRFSQFGKLVLRGMELALELHNRQHPPVAFLVRDSAGDQHLVDRMVSELASSPQVMAVLGPLTGNAASSAAQRAQEAQIPLLTLSQHAGLADTGSWIFRNSLTSALQAETLAEYAVRQQNLTSFGILAPETRLGRELAQAFADAVRARGGRIAATQTYSPQATDFRRPIKLLQGKNPEAPEPEAKADTTGEKKPEPLPPFDALFLPDTPDRLALIAPQLPFYGLAGTRLLGSAGWDAPNLLPLAGQYLETAVFVSGFYRYSPYPFVQEFADLYFERYGVEPSLLDAQGYDVAGIVLSLLARTPSPSRESLRSALNQLQNYPGVTGATRFTPAGEADKVLYLLQIRNGGMVQIN